MFTSGETQVNAGPPRAVMMSVAQLAVRYGVSRSTLRLAIEALESTGHLRRVRGRAGGTFVAERRVERDLTHMTGLPAYLRRQGFEAGTRVLSARLIEADDETVESLDPRTGLALRSAWQLPIERPDGLSAWSFYLPSSPATAAPSSCYQRRR